ncbi:serine hydrolase domain-containing protein [Myxococcus xanthus]|uniref:serine hydrolase domain-containing protein n=1 Tax=Myxococcus xanthus TaxID=34 RepID=UPI0011649147|nr:serine hydrolase [Myxococcus xanthus]QDE81626.1 serine hydrolase [Myxococcus xanthus]QDE95949.1 serine hydrolase [Myxococcus xanthus]QDF03289.1 serine hydrolase [Myxococcus xanthus]
MLKAKALEPVRKLPGYDALVEQARQNARKARLDGGVASGLTKISPRAAGLSEPALAALLKAAEEAGTSALVLMYRGDLVGEWHFGGESHRTESMSATKSVVAMAIGMLIDEGRIPSVDTPISTWFPEWKDGIKSQVTLRHILNHTSGLAAERSGMGIYDARDFVRYALDAEVVDPPGSRFFYSNIAVNLLPGIVERASGEKLDVYLQRKLFEPLGIMDFRWDKDPSGNPVGMAGLQIHPVDFAKLGQVMLQQGTYRAQRFLSQTWVQQCTTSSHPDGSASGLLWWHIYEKSPAMTLVQPMLDEAREKGYSSEKLAKLKDLVGHPMPQEAFAAAIIQRLGSNEELSAFEAKVVRAQYEWKQEGEPVGFAAMGAGGQKLLVFPKHQLVVVRMADMDERVSHQAMAFKALVPLVLDMVRPANARMREPGMAEMP